MDEYFRFRCPQCGQTLKAMPANVGKKARCTCGNVLIVPVPGVAGPAPGRPAALASAPARVPPPPSVAPPVAVVPPLPPLSPPWQADTSDEPWTPSSPLPGGRATRAPRRPTLGSRLAATGSAAAKVWRGLSLRSRLLAGGGAIVALLAIVLLAFWWHSGAAQANGNQSSDSTSALLASVPAVSLSGEELKTALDQGLKISGTLKPESVDNFQQHYHRWVADVVVNNTSKVPCALGNDLFLLELARVDDYNGFSVFGHDSPIVGPRTYGLNQNYELNGARWNFGGDTISIGHCDSEGTLNVLLSAGGNWKLGREFPQYSWMMDSVLQKVQLVLPELCVKTCHGEERFRLVAEFQRKSGGEWSFGSQRIIPIESGALTAMLSDPKSGLATKVLAANWLAERCPEAAPVPLAAASATLREGQVLATCMMLLLHLKAGGAEAHALDLMTDEKAPNGIRSISANYLGAMRYGPGLEKLVTATNDKDSAVASGAIEGLGAYGGPRAIEILTGILRNKERKDFHQTTADALAQTKDSAAIRVLEDEATADNSPALKAICNAGLPETFDFLADLAKKSKDQERCGEIARGLKATRGDKALPVLLDMVQNAEPASEQDGFFVDNLVSVLVEMDKAEATPRLAQMAGAGNLRAARVLAHSKNPSVQAALVTLAGRSQGAVLQTALEGLSERWAGQSVDVFAAALQSDDEKAVCAAIDGLGNSKSPRATSLLVPLLEDKKDEVRRRAACAIENLPPGDQVDKLAQVCLRSSENNVISACVKPLIAGNWQDRSAVPKLVEKLRAAKQYSRYPLVRLLRQVSGNAMGPNDDREWYNDQDGWYKKWLDWGNAQGK